MCHLPWQKGDILEQQANNRSLFKCYSKLLYTIAEGILPCMYHVQLWYQIDCHVIKLINGYDYKLIYIYSPSKNFSLANFILSETLIKLLLMFWILCLFIDFRWQLSFTSITLTTRKPRSQTLSKLVLFSFFYKAKWAQVHKDLFLINMNISEV